MAGDGFGVNVRRQPGVAILDLRGEIDAQAADELNRAYAQAIQQDTSGVLLNFEDVGYINSTGIALIVSLLASARKERRRLTACGLSDHYREIFEITRLDDFIGIFPDEASAVAAASGAPAART